MSQQMAKLWRKLKWLVFFWDTVYREIARQKLAYAGHVLRESGGRNALVILEGKIKGKSKR